MDLATLERACEIVLTSQPGIDPALRQAAQQQVLSLGASVENIPTIQSILDGSMNSFAITVASSSLQKLVTEHWNAFAENQRVDIRNYLLTQLANKGPRLEIFAQTALIQLICRITKYAWLDEGEAIRQIVTETSKFLQSTIYHCIIGLKLLTALVQEMNFRNRNRTLTQQRKIAVSFRDTALFQTFEISLTMLNQLATKQINLDRLSPAEAAQVEDTLLDHSLRLLESCLGFDFLGTNPDESQDDISTLQVPASWRDRIQTGSPLRLLFNIYKGCTTGKIPVKVDAPPQPMGGLAASLGGGTGAGSNVLFGQVPTRDFRISLSRAAQALECASLIVSVRRTTFGSEQDRKKFLNHVVRGSSEILREQQGLAEPDCYHRFCRLLSRIKNNYSLSDLLRSEGYAEWISQVATFTINACGRPLWSANSMHYILGLWSKLVSSIPFAQMESRAGSGSGAGGAAAGAAAGGASSMSGGAASSSSSGEGLLETFIPKIVASYVRGYLEALSNPSTSEEALQSLDDMEALEEQLEHLPTIARYSYDASASAIGQIMDPLIQRYQEGSAMLLKAAQTGGDVTAIGRAIKMVECQLAWLVSVAGCILGGAGMYGSAGSSSSSSAVYYGSSYTASVLGLMGLSPSSMGGGAGGAGGSSGSAAVGDEGYDAELSRRVLGLISQADQRVTNICRELGAPMHKVYNTPVVQLMRPDSRLELAFVFFMQNFRKAYISESSGMPVAPLPGSAGQGPGMLVPSSGKGGKGEKDGSSSSAAAGGAAGGSGSGNAALDFLEGLSSKPTLAEKAASATGRQRVFYNFFMRMGLGDHEVVMDAILRKLCNNLRLWGSRDDILKRTLDCFHDMVHNYGSGRLLLSLENIDSVLRYHTEEYFPFLSMPSNSRARSSWYATLGRLVFMEEESEKFDSFFKGLSDILDRLAGVIHVRSEEVARTIVACCRDLRGLTEAAYHRGAYLQLFEALFPKHIDTLTKGMEVWADTPAVANPLLKFMAEFVLNRSSRVSFGFNSANGILLFRRGSALISAYAGRMASFQPQSDLYPNKYKQVATAIHCITRMLDGGYVNCGVFGLYGDPALDNALKAAFNLLLGLPQSDIFKFPKLSSAFVSFMQVVYRSHMEAVLELPTPAFIQCLENCSEGLDSLDAEVATASAYALDYAATYFVKNMGKDTPAMKAYRTHLSAQPGIWEALMKMLFQVIVFSETSNIQQNQNQWSMSRPMLSVILAAEAVRRDCFEQYRAEIVAGQPSDLRPRMADEFQKLGRDVPRALDSLSRDRWSQKLTVFRNNVKEFAKL